MKYSDCGTTDSPNLGAAKAAPFPPTGAAFLFLCALAAVNLARGVAV